MNARAPIPEPLEAINLKKWNLKSSPPLNHQIQDNAAFAIKTWFLAPLVKSESCLAVLTQAEESC